MPKPDHPYKFLYVYVVYDNHNLEWRIVNMRDNKGNFAPLVTGFERNLPRLRALAQHYANLHKTPVRLLAFAYEEEVEMLQPQEGRSPAPTLPLVRT